MGRRHVLVVLLALLVGSAALAQPGSSARQEGEIFRVVYSPAAGLDFLDPALAFTQPAWSLLDTTCARLYTYPDEPSPASFRVVPEVAASSDVSPDFKTYTFRLRTGFRFSDGKPVRASAFAQAINRALAPVDSPGWVYVRDIVGAQDVHAGRRSTASGVVARGDTLVVRFERPAPDFVTRTTLPYLCAVPPGLQPSEEGAGVIPSAGPYHVTEYRPGERIEIRRNPYYGGRRTVQLDGFDVNLRGGSPTDMVRSVDRGDADWGHMLASIYMDSTLDLVRKYGIDRSRFFVKQGLTLRLLALNSRRPLFRNNPRLRRAVNLAVDRSALLPNAGGPIAARLTDQHLPYVIPGFRDAAIYPLDGANLAKAEELAGGRLRGKKAVLLTTEFALPKQAAQLAAQQLARLGVEIEIRTIPDHIASAEYLEKLTAPGAEWDIALVLWTPNVPDAYAYLHLLIESQQLGGETLTRVRSKLVRAAMQRAVRLPQGRERNQAFATVDAMLARDVAPVVPLNVVNEATLVSDRVAPRCIVLRPVLDLAVACLK